MLRLVCISLEFSAGTFSGNGVYAQSQVRSLSKQACDVLVLSGKPIGHVAAEQTEGPVQLIQVEVPVWERLDRASGWAELATQAASDSIVQHVASFQPCAVLGIDWSSLPAYKALAAALQYKGLHVPPYIFMNYRVHRRTCAPADEHFIQSMESEAVATAAVTVALSRSDADFIQQHLQSLHLPPTTVQVLLPALRADMASLPLPHDVPPQPNKPQVTQDMPAPCHMPLEHAHEQSSPQHDSLSVSSAAAASTAASMAATKRIDDQISPSAAEIEAAGKAVDNTPIRALVKQTSDGTRVSPSIGRRSTHFSTSSEDSLLRDRQTDCAQPLEDDAASDVTQNGWHLHRDVAPHAAGGGQKHECHVGPRSYLTCCVRLSPEKEPHRFVELVEELARQGSLQRLAITPLMCASATTPYALDLVARLQAAAPNCIIQKQFLGPEELVMIYSKTRLNIHPCLYDAYGMTVVEAASQGAPSVVNRGGAVGATDLLKSLSEVFELDLSVPIAQLANQVTELWGNAALLAQIGQAAAYKARSWTESANAATLLSLINKTTNIDF